MLIFGIITHHDIKRFDFKRKWTVGLNLFIGKWNTQSFNCVCEWCLDQDLVMHLKAWNQDKQPEA